MRRVRLLVQWVALLAWPSGGALADLLVVPDDFPTIQAALDAAAGGDSVMIRAGTYAEALTLAGKDLTVFGESRAEATVVTGSQARRVLDLGAGVTLGTVLSDLTFRDGAGVDRGAGIRLEGGASPTIRRCRFVANVAFCWTCDTYGGGLAAGSGSIPVIEDCLFSDNSTQIFDLWTYGSGGAIYAGSGSNLTIRRSTFRGNVAVAFEGGPGGAIFVSTAGVASVEECTFDGNGAGGGAGIFSEGIVEVLRSTFTANQASYGTGIFCRGTFLLAENILFDNECFGASESGGTVLVDGSGHVRRNTIAFNRGSCPDAGIVAWSMAGLAIANNIVAMNGGIGMVIEAPVPGTFACNDVWGNERGGAPANYCGGCPDLTGIDGNISRDPLFCDGPDRDLRLHLDSPCAPGAGACGLIGALGEGCGVSAVAGTEPGPAAGLVVDPRQNPAAPPITIAFTLAAGGAVRLRIHDAAGRAVVSLGGGALAPGRHEVVWDGRTAGGRPAAAGVYFVELEAVGERRSERLVLIR